MEQTLLLNASYEPLMIVPWRRAITLFYLGKAEIVSEHETTVRSVTFTFGLPSVARLLRYVKTRTREVVPFTRQHVYARDGHRCGYCGERFAERDLTFDHIVPQTAGGTKGWENVTSCCMPCNRKKGPRTPAEAGMLLLWQPHRPTRTTVLLRATLGMQTAPKTWSGYLFGSVITEG